MGYGVNLPARWDRVVHTLGHFRLLRRSRNPLFARVRSSRGPARVFGVGGSVRASGGRFLSHGRRTGAAFFSTARVGECGPDCLGLELRG